jgi:UDP-N-acetylglucosamine diphosphorylase/glucosamine-1-phosphate N-acetyltransferase
MTNYILFDDNNAELLPLTYTRPVAELRVGILTISQKWEKYLKSELSWLTEDYLSIKFPLIKGDDNIYINGSILPDLKVVKSILKLRTGQCLAKANIVIAARCNYSLTETFSGNICKASDIVQFQGELNKIGFLWEIFQNNGKAIESDFILLTKNRKSQPISKSNFVKSPENIFIEKGANVEHVSLNATNGPIYIGKNAEIMEGCMIRGPFAICESSVLKMGTKVYGPTTIGPNSKIGGEINNCVIQANSNKAHDGFLGNSVIGEWCNIGADTNNSNLKNNYTEVKLWSYAQGKFVSTGLQFCGLFMGDHSKCGINTMFNTGTVVGVSANIFGSGFPRNFIPSFSWGGPQGMSVYPLDKAIDTASKVFQRRGIELAVSDKKIMEHIFLITDKEHRYS